MNRFLARSLEGIIAFLVFLVIAISGGVGFLFGPTKIPEYGGIFGAGIGLVFGWIVATVTFGSIAVLLDIRELLADVRGLLEQQRPDRTINRRPEPGIR